MGALSFWYFWTKQARKKLINLILKKGKILGEAQFLKIILRNRYTDFNCWYQNTKESFTSKCQAREYVWSGRAPRACPCCAGPPITQDLLMTRQLHRISWWPCSLFITVRNGKKGKKYILNGHFIKSYYWGFTFSEMETSFHYFIDNFLWWKSDQTIILSFWF